jgi:hypothetical protein
MRTVCAISLLHREKVLRDKTKPLGALAEHIPPLDQLTIAAADRYRSIPLESGQLSGAAAPSSSELANLGDSQLGVG